MKLLLPISLFIISLVIAPSVLAKGMDVSRSASFSSADLNFSGGETVYVRVNTEKEGSSHVLNIKDNSYSTVKTVDLSRNGSTYSASFSAPSAEGYYSLEAKIEGAGVSVTSVKTIKVGSPSGANVRVKVESKVEGERSTGGSDKSENQSVGVSEDSDRSDKSDDEVTEEQRDIEVEDIEDEKADSKGIFELVFAVVENLLKFLRVN